MLATRTSAKTTPVLIIAATLAAVFTGAATATAQTDSLAFAQTADPGPPVVGPGNIAVLVVAALTGAVAWRWVAARPLNAWNRQPPTPPTTALAIAFGLFLTIPLAAGLAQSTGLAHPTFLGAAAAATAAMIVAFWAGMLPTARALVAGLVAAVVIVPTVFGVSVLATAAARLLGVDIDPTAHNAFDTILGGGPAAAAAITTSVVAVPILEEVVFRGFLHDAVRPLAGDRTRAGAVVTSLIVGTVFGLLHAAAVPPYMLPVLITLGVLLGLLREGLHTRGPLAHGRPGVAASVVVHVAFNALNVALAFAAR
ncbi:MAG: CPBP family intramembrane glutamic endopeptidase [Planctomycetota bacterium]